MAKQTVLTKEYFEEHLDRVLDKRLKINAKEIKAHVSKEIGDLAAMNAREFRRADERFDTVDRKLDRVALVTENHEKRMKRVEKAIGVPEVI